MATWERIALRAKERIPLRAEEKAETYEKAYKEAKAIIYNLQNDLEKRSAIEVHAYLDSLVKE